MTSKKQQEKEYSELSKITQDRHASMLKKLYKADISLTDIKGKTDLEIKEILNSEAKSMKPYRRLFNQMSKNESRRNIVKENTITKFEKDGYKGKRLNQVKKDLIKTVSSTFFEIANNLRDKYKEKEKDSYKHAKLLLAIPKTEYDSLEQQELDILTDYDY